MRRRCLSCSCELGKGHRHKAALAVLDVKDSLLGSYNTLCSGGGGRRQGLQLWGCTTQRQGCSWGRLQLVVIRRRLLWSSDWRRSCVRLLKVQLIGGVLRGWWVYCWALRRLKQSRCPQVPVILNGAHDRLRQLDAQLYHVPQSQG